MSFRVVTSQMTFDWTLNVGGHSGSPIEILAMLACIVFERVQMSSSTIFSLPPAPAPCTSSEWWFTGNDSCDSDFFYELPCTSLLPRHGKTLLTMVYFIFQRLSCLCYAWSIRYWYQIPLKGINTQSRGQDLTWLLLKNNDTYEKISQRLSLTIMLIIL